MQRVAVARALANRPRVILADEPTGNLDSRSGHGIIELFRELWHEGVTVVLITHDLGLARVCPRILKIQDGRIVHDGADVPVEDETTDEAVHAEPVAVATVAGSPARLSGWGRVLRAVRGGRGERGTRGLEPVRG
jgi:macrolide transport system ATP-binding/permease protein